DRRVSLRASAAPESVDVDTAIKTAQAIAREIDIKKLLEKLLSFAIENAGAERGCLILEHEGQASIEAQGTAQFVEVDLNCAAPLDRATNLSTGIVNYVRRTLKTIILADARVDDLYGNDEYVVRRQPRSILCTPVLKQGRLVGVLYLENHLV